MDEKRREDISRDLKGVYRTENAGKRVCLYNFRSNGEYVMRTWIFKHRGLLLLPSAAMLLIFGRPTLWSFILGAVFLFGGEAVRIWGVGYAGVTTRSDKVEAPYLVTAGPYAYIRNPLYFGNFFCRLWFFNYGLRGGYLSG